MDLKQLGEVLKNSGVVGAGGAGFPTYAKLDARAETIIMNCAECEPLLKLHQQLLEAYADEILSAFYAIMQACGAKEGIVGIKKAYKKTISALEG
jgi:Na+-translocating ferredoxin:NAD+ oxidoreductase RnfC subunit